MSILSRRLSAVEARITRHDGRRVAVVDIYEGETNDEAIAAHEAATGCVIDRSASALTVLIRNFGEHRDGTPLAA